MKLKLINLLGIYLMGAPFALGSCIRKSDDVQSLRSPDASVQSLISPGEGLVMGLSPIKNQALQSNASPEQTLNEVLICNVSGAEVISSSCQNPYVDEDGKPGIVATALNSPEVRDSLIKKGYIIPAEKVVGAIVLTVATYMGAKKAVGFFESILASNPPRPWVTLFLNTTSKASAVAAKPSVIAAAGGAGSLLGWFSLKKLYAEHGGEGERDLSKALDSLSKVDNFKNATGEELSQLGNVQSVKSLVIPLSKTLDLKLATWVQTRWPDLIQ